MAEGTEGFAVAGWMGVLVVAAHAIIWGQDRLALWDWRRYICLQVDVIGGILGSRGGGFRTWPVGPVWPSHSLLHLVRLLSVTTPSHRASLLAQGQADAGAIAAPVFCWAVFDEFGTRGGWVPRSSSFRKSEQRRRGWHGGRDSHRGRSWDVVDRIEDP